MATDKTAVFGFPTPAYDYGDGVESAAALEFTSLMLAAEVGIISAIDAVSNALSVEVGDRTSADAVIANNISVVSAAVDIKANAVSVVSAQVVSVFGVLVVDKNTVSNNLSNAISNRTTEDLAVVALKDVVSAQVVSVFANLTSNKDVVSNALSNVISNRVSHLNPLSIAANVVSAALDTTRADRISALQLVSVLVNPLSVLVNNMSQAVSVISAANIQKAINTANQATITVSTGITVSGVSIPLLQDASYYFRFIIPYLTMNVAAGVTIGVTGPAMTSYVARTKVPKTGTAQATVYNFGTIGTIGGKISAVSHPVSGVTLMAEIEGFANPSAAGSLHCVISISVAVTAGKLVVLKGAQAQAWKLL